MKAEEIAEKRASSPAGWQLLKAPDVEDFLICGLLRVLVVEYRVYVVLLG